MIKLTIYLYFLINLKYFIIVSCLFSLLKIYFSHSIVRIFVAQCSQIELYFFLFLPLAHYKLLTVCSAAASQRRRQVALASATQCQQRRKVCQQFSIARSSRVDNFCKQFLSYSCHTFNCFMRFLCASSGWQRDGGGSECIKNANIA